MLPYDTSVTGYITAGDYDGDGKDDVALICKSWGVNVILVFCSNGASFISGSWGSIAILNNLGGTLQGRLVNGDFNADGGQRSNLLILLS